MSTPATYSLYQVTPEVRLELERIHHGRLEIEKPDEMNPAREQLLAAGWLSNSESIFGSWLEIIPLALTRTGRQLRPNRDHHFVLDQVKGWILAR
jgi:hypothetical protein